MRTADLFDLLDSGLPLPDEVRRLGDAARALAGLSVPPLPAKPPDQRAMAAQVVSDAVIAAEKGKPALPDVARLAEAEAAVKAWETDVLALRRQGELLKAARGEAIANLRDTLAESATEVIGGLAVELDELMVELRSLAPLVRGLTVVSALKAPKDVRSAWARIDELTVRYSSIRSAQIGITDLVGVRHDTPGYFTLFRNLPDVWPGYAKPAYAAPPWPTTDTRSFLLWVADHPDFEVWCPTPAQRDARWLEVIGTGQAGTMTRVRSEVGA